MTVSAHWSNHVLALFVFAILTATERRPLPAFAKKKKEILLYLLLLLLKYCYILVRSVCPKQVNIWRLGASKGDETNPSHVTVRANLKQPANKSWTITERSGLHNYRVYSNRGVPSFGLNVVFIRRPRPEYCHYTRHPHLNFSFRLNLFLRELTDVRYRPISQHMR